MPIRLEEAKKICAILSVALLLTVLIAPVPSAALPWHRRAINITNAGGSELTDFQVLVTLNTSNFDYYLEDVSMAR